MDTPDRLRTLMQKCTPAKGWPDRREASALGTWVRPHTSLSVEGYKTYAVSDGCVATLRAKRVTSGCEPSSREASLECKSQD